MILVTGAGGFLGGAIARRLVESGRSVRGFSRQRYSSLEQLGVEQHLGDLADATAVENAVAGCELVYHVAAKAGIWGPAAEFESANVTGTANIIAACRKHGVSKLVFTSSPSVVANSRDLNGVNESMPYPDHFEADYPRTKAAAEQTIRAANDNQLATVSLRPHLIWGPGDNHLIPRLLKRAQANSLRLIGDGSQLVDTTFIDNAVDAHLLAAERLHPGSPIAGKVYFISNGEPMAVREFMNKVLALAGLRPIDRFVSRRTATIAAAVMETTFQLLRLRGEPRLTRFLVSELATAHWFDLSAARRDLDYEPKVSIEEGLKRSGEWIRGLTGPHPSAVK